MSATLETLRSHQFIPPTDDYQMYPSQAAVLIGVTDDPREPEFILTLRSAHLSSHAGQVAFPGGKWDREDRSLMETALRESHEEIGLEPQAVEVLGAMPTARTGWDVLVTPYVGIVPTGVNLTPNLGELDSIFRVPLSFFLDGDRRARTDVFNRDRAHQWAPAYHYDGYEIWGFTASVIVSFLNRTFDADIVRESAAPVRKWDY